MNLLLMSCISIISIIAIGTFYTFLTSTEKTYTVYLSAHQAQSICGPAYKKGNYKLLFVQSKKTPIWVYKLLSSPKDTLYLTCKDSTFFGKNIDITDKPYLATPLIQQVNKHSEKINIENSKTRDAKPNPTLAKQ